MPPRIMRSYSKKCSYVDQFSNQDSLWGIPDYAVPLGAITPAHSHRKIEGKIVLKSLFWPYYDRIFQYLVCL